MIICIKSLYTSKFSSYYENYNTKGEKLIFAEDIEAIKSSFSEISSESIKILIDTTCNAKNFNGNSLESVILSLRQVLQEMIPKNINIDCHYFILSEQMALYQFEEEISFYQFSLYTSGKSLLEKIENFHFPVVFALINSLNRPLLHNEIIDTLLKNQALKDFNIENNTLIIDYDFLYATKGISAMPHNDLFKDYMFKKQKNIQKDVFQLCQHFEKYHTLSLCQSITDLEAISFNDLVNLVQIGKQQYSVQIIYVNPLHIQLSQKILNFADHIVISTDFKEDSKMQLIKSSVNQIVKEPKPIMLLPIDNNYYDFGEKGI